MRKVSGLMAVIALAVSCAAAAYADSNVTVPNTFSSGTTAKAAEVNADFDALVKAVPGVKVVDASLSSASLTTTWTNVGQIAIAAPRAGYVIVKSNGYINLSANQYAQVAVSDSSTALGTGSHYLQIGATGTYAQIPYNVEYVFTVSAGSATYYLVCRGTSSFTLESISGVIVAEFIPNSY